MLMLMLDASDASAFDLASKRAIVQAPPNATSGGLRSAS